MSNDIVNLNCWRGQCSFTIQTTVCILRNALICWKHARLLLPRLLNIINLHVCKANMNINILTNELLNIAKNEQTHSQNTKKVDGGGLEAGWKHKRQERVPLCTHTYTHTHTHTHTRRGTMHLCPLRPVT